MKDDTIATPPRTGQEMAREAGFSLIEVLVAAALFLLIALGVIPLFARSMLNNLEGSESTDAVNFAGVQAESLLPLPFSHVLLTVPAGLTALTTDDYYEMQWVTEAGQEYYVDKGWTAVLPADDLLRWRRRTTVEQYGIQDLKDNNRLDTPLDGSTDAGSVQFKVVTVRLGNAREGKQPDLNNLVQQQSMILRQMKATGSGLPF